MGWDMSYYWGLGVGRGGLESTAFRSQKRPMIANFLWQLFWVAHAWNWLQLSSDAGELASDGVDLSRSGSRQDFRPLHFAWKTETLGEFRYNTNEKGPAWKAVIGEGLPKRTLSYREKRA